MNVQKIVMILDHNTIKIKYRMMVFILIYFNLKLITQEIIGLCLDIDDMRLAGGIDFDTKKPNIDITTWPMLGNRIIKA